MENDRRSLCQRKWQDDSHYHSKQYLKKAIRKAFKMPNMSFNYRECSSHRFGLPLKYFSAVITSKKNWIELTKWLSDFNFRSSLDNGILKTCHKPPVASYNSITICECIWNIFYWQHLCEDSNWTYHHPVIIVKRWWTVLKWSSKLIKQISLLSTNFMWNLLCGNTAQKRDFLLRNFSLNLTKSGFSCEFDHIYWRSP